jgi:LmbE family N-acetylglucosaminyl deacetylase
MRPLLVCILASMASVFAAGGEQGKPRTLVAVFAHPDDEGAASPILARYAR